MALRRSPNWRDLASAELMTSVLREATLEGDVLVMLEGRPEVAAVVGALGARPHSWHRMTLADRRASAWPPAGPFDAATLRLPRAKDELQMSVHAAAASLRSGARLWVYGVGDEGIRSAKPFLEPLFEGVRTVSTGGRCRVLGAERSQVSTGVKGALADWARITRVVMPDSPRDWISYPGVFAHGRVDAGTSALVEVVSSLPKGGRVLDFACGSGLIGATVASADPSVCVEFLDADAVALEAVSQNVPDAQVILSDGYAEVRGPSYDMIVSNPPYHAGKTESGRMLERLMTGAPRHLKRGGTLLFVTQRRLRVASLLESTFPVTEVVLDRGLHRVWRGELSENPPLRAPHSLDS